MLDFNDADLQHAATHEKLDRETVRQALLARLPSILATLLPAGTFSGNVFSVGDVYGSRGESLKVTLTGDDAGLWKDHAADQGGDIFSLIALTHGLNTQADFGQVLAKAAELCGHAVPIEPMPIKRPQPIDDLGPHTAKWDYHDAHGKLIAVVYRYDPPGRKKQFRPWDPIQRKMAAPDRRPLYNQPGLIEVEQVVLVEGEKCAQALIDAGVVATTAMNGAKAPVNKTDWSPLAQKHVIVWPDADEPGMDYAMAAAQTLLAAGALSCHILLVPEESPRGWDAADAIAEGVDVQDFIKHSAKMHVTSPSNASEQVNSVPDSEDALALTFTQDYAHDWCYVAGWGKWQMWDGRRWKADETLLVRHLVRLTCRAASAQTTSVRTAAKLSANSTISAV